MTGQPDWVVWLPALAVCALFGWFFWHVATGLLGYSRQLIHTLQHWPEIRRAMVEAEARAGGRYPPWFRAVRVTLVLAMIALMAMLLWRKLSP